MFITDALELYAPETLFGRFDLDKSGDLDPAEFELMIRSVAPGPRDAEIRTFFQEHDLDHDGRVSLAELSSCWPERDRASFAPPPARG